MDAYYYDFTKTGVGAVDEILSAVACAGKGYHHTESWNEPGLDGGPSYVEKIQDAADRLAGKVLALQAVPAVQEVERGA